MSEDDRHLFAIGSSAGILLWLQYVTRQEEEHVDEKINMVRSGAMPVVTMPIN